MQVKEWYQHLEELPPGFVQETAQGFARKIAPYVDVVAAFLKEQGGAFQPELWQGRASVASSCYADDGNTRVPGTEYYLAWLYPFFPGMYEPQNVVWNIYEGRATASFSFTLKLQVRDFDGRCQGGNSTDRCWSAYLGTYEGFSDTKHGQLRLGYGWSESPRLWKEALAVGLEALDATLRRHRQLDWLQTQFDRRGMPG